MNSPIRVWYPDEDNSAYEYIKINTTAKSPDNVGVKHDELYTETTTPVTKHKYQTEIHHMPTGDSSSFPNTTMPVSLPVTTELSTIKPHTLEQKKEGM